MKKDEFKITTYGKQELAQLYNVSWRTMKNWIERNRQLKDDLEAAGYNNTKCHTFTPHQVGIIIQYLGEP